MHAVSLGYVIVAAAGTPTNLGTVLTALNLPADVLQGRKVYCVEVRPLLTNTGKSYVGLKSTARGAGGVGMTVSTGVNVLKQFQPPSATGIQDRFELEGADNDVLVDDYAIDVAVNGEGVSVVLTIL